MAHRLLSLMPSPDETGRVLNGTLATTITHAYFARPGERPAMLHLILEGWACRYQLLPDGRRQITDLLLPGDLCDIDWLNGFKTSLPAMALTPMRTIALERGAVEALARQQPSFSDCLLTDAQEKFARRGEAILSLGRRSAIERVAHALCGIFVRLQRSGLAREHTCDFRITQLEMGDHVGLTSVHVNRVVQDLRRRNLIELQHHRLTILDFEKLARLGQFTAEPINDNPVSQYINLKEGH